MSYLIDTHIFLWWLFDDPKLGANCRDIICNPDHRIIVSSASAWEIATNSQDRRCQIACSCFLPLDAEERCFVYSAPYKIGV